MLQDQINHYARLCRVKLSVREVIQSEGTVSIGVKGLNPTAREFLRRYFLGSKLFVYEV